MNTPNVWIGCLASYNAGRICGEWFTPEDYSDANEMQAAVTAMLQAAEAKHRDILCGPCEEYYVGAHEEFAFTIGQHESVADLFDKAQWTANADDVGALLAAIAVMGESYVVDGLRDDEDWVTDRLVGSSETPGDFAFELCGDEVPDMLSYYIDWEAFERDLEYAQAEIEGTTYFFDNR